MATIEQLDAIIQKIASFNISQISKQNNCIGHHLIRRQNLLFRWDLRNIMYCTAYQHKLIHSIAGYEAQHLSINQIAFKEENKNKSFKQYLLTEGITEQEFIDRKYIELKQLEPSKYDLYIKNRQINGIATYHTINKEIKEIDNLKHILEERKVKPRILKPINKTLTIQKEYRHEIYLKNKEFKNNLKQI